MKLLVNLGLAQHPKTLQLATDLKISIYGAVGVLVCLWTWVMKFRDHGDIGGLSPMQISQAVGWTGDPDELVTALIGAGFLDRVKGGKKGIKLQVHEWQEHQGRLIRERIAARERQTRRRSRVSHALVTRDVTLSNRDSHAAPFPSPFPSPLPSSPKKEREEAPPAHEIDGSIELLMKRALDAKIPNNESTIRRYVESWRIRVGGARVEEVLMDPWTRGRTVIEIQDHFFPKATEEKPVITLEKIAEIRKRVEEKDRLEAEAARLRAEGRGNQR